MFTFDLYKPIFNKKADDQKLVSVSKIFAIITAVVTLFLAPNLVHAADGVFIFVSKFAGFIAIPIAVLVTLGVFVQQLRVPPPAAIFVILFHIFTYFILVWGLSIFSLEITIHFMHVFTILFILEALILVAWAKLRPHSETYLHLHAPKIPMKAWRFSMLVSAMLLSCAALTYVFFSKLGFAYSDGVVAPSFLTLLAVSSTICFAFCYWAHVWLQPRYEHYVSRRYG